MSRWCEYGKVFYLPDDENMLCRQPAVFTVSVGVFTSSDYDQFGLCEEHRKVWREVMGDAG